MACVFHSVLNKKIFLVHIYSIDTGSIASIKTAIFPISLLKLLAKLQWGFAVAQSCGGAILQVPKLLRWRSFASTETTSVAQFCKY